MRIKAGDSTKSATPLTGLRLGLVGLMICGAVHLLAPRPTTIAGQNETPAMSFAAGPVASGSVTITSAGSTVFVVNPDSGSVSAADTRTDEKIGEVFVGDEPRSLSLSPDGQRLFVTNHGSSTLTVLDAARLAVLATIRVGAEPSGVVADPTGQFVYIASSATASVEGVAAAVALRIKADGTQSFEPVARFDAATNRFVSAPIDLGPANDQVFLILFGTGFRFVSSPSAAVATIGAANVEVLFAGAAPDFVGMDQANVRLPRSLIGRGEVDVVLAVDGKTANAVRISFK